MITLICLILVLIGAINWLIIGIFNWNLVGAIFGGWTVWGSRVIYIIVGIAALWLIYVAIFRRDIISYSNDFKSYKKEKID